MIENLKRNVSEEKERLQVSEKAVPDGRTHYEGCWQDRRHHDCALNHIAALEAERQQVKAVPVIPTKWFFGEISDEDVPGSEQGWVRFLDHAKVIATLTAEVDALKRQQSLLVEGIVGAAIEMGVTDGSLPLTGSQLLMIVNDTKCGIAALKAEVARLSAPVTDAEWTKHYSMLFPRGTTGTDRAGVDALILARATPPQS